MRHAAAPESPIRGPKPHLDRGTPTGYRVNARTRFELGMAQSFLGTTSLQDTIDFAVRNLLRELAEDSGFTAALHAAEASRRRRARVPTIQVTER